MQLISYIRQTEFESPVRLAHSASSAQLPQNWDPLYSPRMQTVEPLIPVAQVQKKGPLPQVLGPPQRSSPATQMFTSSTQMSSMHWAQNGQLPVQSSVPPQPSLTAEPQELAGQLVRGLQQPPLKQTRPSAQQLLGHACRSGQQLPFTQVVPASQHTSSQARWSGQHAPSTQLEPASQQIAPQVVDPAGHVQTFRPVLAGVGSQVSPSQQSPALRQI